jgi:hypothetical protein
MKDGAARRASNDRGHNAAKGTLVPRKRAGFIGSPQSLGTGISDDKRTSNDAIECRTFDENSSC